MILDTRGYPLTVSEHLVQFAGLFGTTEIHSNGKELGPGDGIMVWNYIKCDNFSPSRSFSYK